MRRACKDVTERRKVIRQSQWKNMNDFESKVQEITRSCLKACDIGTLQVNVGFRCNHQCTHCHIQATPERTEMMDWATMQHVLDTARKIQPKLIDITGGAPELNPLLQRFVRSLRENRHNVQVRTNLTVLLQPTMETMMNFYRDTGVKLVASFPCYTKKNVDPVRGDGVFEKSIEALNSLNAIGYGSDPSLKLDLVYNPAGAFLPPEQSSLESDYRKELEANFGIVFNNLITLTNMPIGRFLQLLRQQNQYREYDRLLRESFNPKTLDGLMCRHQVEVGWDGTLYDCDFNLALQLPISCGAPSHITDFSLATHSSRRIVTGNHCFGCTAGYGSSCGGALAG